MGIEKAKQEMIPNKKKTSIKRWIYGSLVVIVMLCLFISSAFVLPTMAQVVSKIPYLNKIFVSNDNFLTDISDTLDKNGYPVQK
ncbi:DUF4179 domain-containing protein [Heyndrickxia ginsengihumi]|uniref:DUF4179 domain-containing protein n=1 Tax=Heyndrickxia ginsengihumi TaxID=363870 RepID=UPI003D194428